MDQQYEGFYDVFRPAVEVNPALVRLQRKCALELPKGLPSVEFEATLTFTRTGGKHYLTEAEIEYDLLDIEDYVTCVRDSYLSVAPEFAGPEALPETFKIETRTRFYVTDFKSIAEVRDFIDRMVTEMGHTSGENERLVLEQQIEVYECVAEKGLDKKRECLEEL